jgi:hypothetical protein
MTNIGKGERLMWLRIGTFLGLSVWLVLATANDARAQDVLWVPRSQLFAAVLGQEIGQTLAHVMNAYALGKARKEELEALRSQVAKCGDNCSDAIENPCVGGSIPPLGTIDFIDFFSFQVTKNGPFSYRNALQQKASIFANSQWLPVTPCNTLAPGPCTREGHPSSA